MAAAPTLHGVMHSFVEEIFRLIDVCAVKLEVDLHQLDSGDEMLKRTHANQNAYWPIESRSWWDGPVGEDVHELSRPVVWKDRTIGTFWVRSRQSFDPERLPLLDRLSPPAAILIWKARRYEQLRDAKREWEVTFDGSWDGVCITGPGDIILRANRAYGRIIGRSLGDILNLPRQEVLDSLPGWEEISPWQTSEAAGGEAEYASRQFRFNDADVNAPVSGRVFSETRWAFHLPLPDDENLDVCNLNGSSHAKSEAALHHMVVVREVTDARRLQDQLLQSEKMAALGELVSGVAHELNNPLATVVGYSQLMEDDPTLPEHVRRQVKLVHQEAQRASGIVQNLLAFARGSAPEKTEVSVNETLESLVKLRAYQLQADNIRVVTDYAPDLPPVWGDPLQLQQVFLNIVNNAAQAMNEWRGGGELRICTQRVRLDESTSGSGQGICITFTDNGPGIAPEHLRRIFDPFFTTKGVGRGTGLGMSISVGIVSNHNGRIWADSRVGHGARFCIELPSMGAPTQYAPEEERPLSSEESLPSLEAPQAKHILVIDDEEPVITLISEILSLDGYEVTPAFNGAEALALLQVQEFDLIISDVRMPAVGGPTFFEILQTTRPDLLPHVIFVTGDTVSPSTQSFLQQTLRPMLTKPFDPDRLRAMVAQNVNGQELSVVGSPGLTD